MSGHCETAWPRCVARACHIAPAAPTRRVVGLARRLQPLIAVWHTTKRHWHELRCKRAGRRFQAFYEAHAGHRLGWGRWLTLSAALVSFAVGVVLAFIPGPAVVFFALTAALLSTQSRWLARKLDRSELYARAIWRKHRRRRRERQPQRRSVLVQSGSETR